MNMFKTTLVLIVLGLLLSLAPQAKSVSNDIITLSAKNHIVFAGPVSDESVAKAQIQLAQISADLAKTETIYIVIDSPGGSVPAGNRFIDFANSLPQKIKPICLFCASMGYHMFQSFGERLVFSSSELMSHRVSIGGLGGQVPGEAVTRLNDIMATSNSMDEKVAKRVGLSVKEYQKLIYDELWLNGDNAVKTNHADRIAKIRCTKELTEGRKVEDLMTMFGPVSVTQSTCPLISGFLDLKFNRESFRSVEEVKQLVRKTKRTVTIQQ